MAVLPGYTRLPGTSRNYRSPSGEVISRRAYEGRVTAANARTSMAPTRYATQVRAQRGYNRVLQAYAKKQRGSGKAAGKKQLRESSEFKAIVKDIRSAAKRPKITKDNPLGRRTLDQDMKLRLALKRAGLRDNIPDWVPVGLSDARKKGLIRRQRDIPRKFRYAA